MARTLLVGTGAEIALNTPTSLGNATVVRVFNNTAADATVSVAKVLQLVMQALQQ